MIIKNITTHEGCGGYWLKKIVGYTKGVIEEDYRCTRCGKWRSGDVA